MALISQAMDGAIQLFSTQNKLRAGAEEAIADGGSITFDLQEAVFVLVVASTNATLVDNAEYALALVSEGGASNILVSSANVAASDTAGNFCVYGSGGDLAFKNNRGSTRYVSYWLLEV